MDLLCFQRIMQKIISYFIVLCFKCKTSSRTEAPNDFQLFAKFFLVYSSEDE